MKNVLQIAVILLLAGCEPRLETGYVPRPLDSTPADRQSYYAPAFTPEAHPPKEKGGGALDGLHN